MNENIFPFGPPRIKCDSENLAIKLADKLKRISPYAPRYEVLEIKYFLEDFYDETLEAISKEIELLCDCGSPIPPKHSKYCQVGYVVNHIRELKVSAIKERVTRL